MSEKPSPVIGGPSTRSGRRKGPGSIRTCLELCPSWPRRWRTASPLSEQGLIDDLVDELGKCVSGLF